VSTTNEFRADARNAALPWTLALTAAVFATLLVGVEPVGGDPDRLYRPIKAELARTMQEGTGPYWSDRLGMGFPLAAESHAAAFYPPNQVLYRLLPVPVAYRVAMFAHELMLAWATFAYARCLGLSPPGSALAAVTFVLCGFQSIHSSHEVFYHAMPYLPLCLLLGERIMADGRGSWVAALAAAFGLQLTVGHFQIQSWTAGLVAAAALWRWLASPGKVGRLAAVLGGLAWGAAIAAVQLGPTSELTRFVGYDDRPALELAFYGLPPAHWAELVAPSWLRGIPGGPEARYWYALGTTGYEACFYIGTVPLLFAFIGLLSARSAAMRFWIAAASATFVLAILPGLWLQGYVWMTSIPGLGLFRAPGRYVALTSLGLALLAGRGFDRSVSRRVGGLGLGLGLAFAVAGFAWIAAWSFRPDHVRELGGDRLLIRLATAAGVWALAAILVAGWIRGRIPAAVLLLATAAELGALYYTSTTEWGRSIPIPAASPILTRLEQESDVGKVAGLLSDIPLRMGLSPLYPNTGFAPPPPHPSLAILARRDVPFRGFGDPLLQAFGATHGVWDGPVDSTIAETILATRDDALDRLVHKPPGAPEHAVWHLVRFKDPFPAARVVTRRPTYSDDENLLTYLSRDSVQYGVRDRPTSDDGPRATRAEVSSWDGRAATVEHDGACDLVINRTYYPGWTFRVDDGPERPVLRANRGIQAARLAGAGVHRVTFAYRPTNQSATAGLSVAATLAVVATLILGLRRSAARQKHARD